MCGNGMSKKGDQCCLTLHYKKVCKVMFWVEIEIECKTFKKKKIKVD